MRKFSSSQADTLPLLATLLSLPQPEGAAPLTLSPQKQKQKTQEALVAWIVEEAEKAAVYCAWEDLHWADPSTLEFLTLFLDQVPATCLLTVLTFPPDFTPPWRSHSHIAQITLTRLGRPQVEAMVEQVTGGKALPVDVLRQIVTKTDGVPLFVEELTKMVVETRREQGTGNREQEGKIVGAYQAAPLPALGIPATLHDALMARLDRLGSTKEIAQVGATIGREFNYDVLQAISPLNAETLQKGLRQLVAAELVYQSGVPPQARYLFKHALIQDTAYQSLLKSKRQQLHQQIAQVLAERFPETIETQPELLAHHYTEAGLIAQALPYWQQAGERASQRSAYVEAVSHFTKGLELLKTLPDPDKRVQQELTLQLALGGSLTATKGYASPDVEKVVSRARELCQQMGETPQLFPVLGALINFYFNKGEFKTAHELGEQYFSLAHVQDPNLLMGGHTALGCALFRFGKLVTALEHFEQSMALYNPQQHRSLASHMAHDLQVCNLTYASWTLWLLGYADQALKRGYEALTWAQELSHSFSLAFALTGAAETHLLRREWQAAQEWAEALITLSNEQGFPYWLASGAFRQGKALAEQGQGEEGIAQMRRVIAAGQAMGTAIGRPGHLTMLAEAYGKVGQVEEGLTILTEALEIVHKTGEGNSEAELYRLKGELLLQQSQDNSLEAEGAFP